MVVFHKICYISHVNVEMLKTLKMAIKLFQRPVFRKRLTNVTLICNLKAAISAYSRTAKINCFIYLQFTCTKQTNFLPTNFGNYSKGVFGNHWTANAKFCDIVQFGRS